MPRNGSGTYNLPSNGWNPATNGTPATAADWNATAADLATALTQSLSRDGQTPLINNLPAGNNKITGLSAGTTSGDSLRFEQLFSQGQPANIASAATTDIGAQLTTLLNVTGTTTITSFGTNYNGPRYLRFDGVLTLTHNATTLIIPGGANITTAAGDSCIVVPNGVPANGWRVIEYQRTGGFDLLNTTRIDVASAATVDLNVSAPGTRHINITGTTTITAFTVSVGQIYFVRFDGSLTLTNNASIITQTGANIETRAGDTCMIRATAANIVEVLSYAQRMPIQQIQPITASVGSNALTITLNPTELDFRSATLSSGATNRRKITSAISLTVASGATLGTVNAVASRLVVLAIDNSGTVELAVVNIAGGNNLDETGVISTTALSGSSNSASVIYSTTARTNVPYRVVGIVESTQTTAGTWAASPSLIQGSGGQAVTAMSSLGYGQTWRDVTGSRTSATTYYNTTGKPIMLCITVSLNNGEDAFIVINGTNTSYANPFGGFTGEISFTLIGVVPPGQSYRLNFTGAIGLAAWCELR